MWLLDTNVVSHLRKPRPADDPVRAWVGLQPDDSLFIAAATVGEIQFGIEQTRRANPESAKGLELWLREIAASHQVLNADEAVFRRWGVLMARQSPDLIMDALIAATAEVHQLTLVSRNVRDFQRLGVAVLNPFEAG
jgi:predicted nucleic acid-binding protein